MWLNKGHTLLRFSFHFMYIFYSRIHYFEESYPLAVVSDFHCFWHWQSEGVLVGTLWKPQMGLSDAHSVCFGRKTGKLCFSSHTVQSQHEKPGCWLTWHKQCLSGLLPTQYFWEVIMHCPYLGSEEFHGGINIDFLEFLCIGLGI